MIVQVYIYIERERVCIFFKCQTADTQLEPTEVYQILSVRQEITFLGAL